MRPTLLLLSSVIAEFASAAPPETPKPLDQVTVEGRTVRHSRNA
jgi:hypothetical protein